MSIIRPLAPFTVRPVKQSSVRRTVSAATIADLAAVDLNPITPARQPLKSQSAARSPRLRIIGRNAD